MHVLLTGGAGYIGSHTGIELLENNHSVTIVDSLVNSNAESIKRMEQITSQPIPFYAFDIRDETKLKELFSHNQFDAVIHFAGLKAVGESVAEPINYYTNNLDSTFSLLRTMQKHQVKNLIFSSSATVYGTPASLPITETSQVGVGITNPYGQTKYMIEQILQDVVTADPSWQITTLRYFNPVGAHSSGLIGEDPKGTPSNLLPFVAQVAVGKREKVMVFGDDYETLDGTGVRDYIHVSDLAKGHLAALTHNKSGYTTYNLGTGKGVSVLELIKKFSIAAKREIPYEITDRRPGDIASCYADASLANENLGWYAEKTIDDACSDAWRWQTLNPNGF